jgi:SWI/SNF-related matrix-associated actin-dependent regulator 1 of chromatin subfamily A
MLIERNKISGYEYAFSFDFNLEVVNFCKFLSERHGFRKFTFFDKNWRFTDIETAVEIKDRYPEVRISDDLLIEYELADYLSKEAVLAKNNADRLKQSKDSNLEIKGIKGNLFPYQKIGVEFFINSGGRAMNADPMGVGKTLQALGYVAHQNIQKTLVVCPACVKYNWQNEVKKWTHLKPFIINGGTPISDIKKDFEKFNIFIINYDILKKFFIFLMEANFELIVFDEVHMIKNKTAARTKLAKKLGAKIPKKILLSGTPFLSRPIELFNALNMLDPKTWSDYYSYSRRYCNGHLGRWGWDDKGASNIAELQERISPYFIRRSKKEILPDLPEKRFINHPVELDSRTKEEYRLAEEEFGEFLISKKNKTVSEAQKSLQAEKLVKLGALRQLTSSGKVEAAKEIIAGIIEEGEKVVVFSSYNSPLQEMYTHFKDKAVIVTGQVGAEERSTRVDFFQNNEDCKIFFGGIKSAGVGINLTSATNVLFLDYSWVPGDHMQAIDRIHRVGSVSNYVTIYQLYSKKTVDEYMYKLLEKKQLLFEQIIDGKTDATVVSKSYASNIIKTIERRSLQNVIKNKKANKNG